MAEFKHGSEVNLGNNEFEKTKNAEPSAELNNERSSELNLDNGANSGDKNVTSKDAGQKNEINPPTNDGNASGGNSDITKGETKTDSMTSAGSAELADPNSNELEDPNKSELTDPGKNELADPGKNALTDPNSSELTDPVSEGEVVPQNPDNTDGVDNFKPEYTTDEAKFSSQNYNRLIEDRANAAYDNAKSLGMSDEEAKRYSDYIKADILERKESTGKYSNETRILHYSDAKGKEAMEEAKAKNLSQKEQERAYDDAFRRTYINEKSKEAFEIEYLKTGDEKRAGERQRQVEAISEKNLKGGRVDNYKPGSKYYELYDNARKNDNVTVGHPGAFKDDELNAVHSKYGSASGQYLGTEIPKSRREVIREGSLTASNRADVADIYKINDKDKFGDDVYGIRSNTAPQIHKVNEKSPAFDGAKGKREGGREQVALSSQGVYDGSIEKVGEKNLNKLDFLSKGAERNNFATVEGYAAKLAGKAGVFIADRFFDLPPEVNDTLGDGVDTLARVYDRKLVESSIGFDPEKNMLPSDDDGDPNSSPLDLEKNKD